MYDVLNNNRLQRALRVRRRWYVGIHLAAVAFISGAMVLSLPTQASAATIYSQTVHDGMLPGRIPPGQTKHYALGQIAGTVDFIKVRAQNYLGASNTVEVALLCYDDSGYTSLNSSCSWNNSGNRDGTVGRFIASSNSDVEFTVTPTVDFALTPGKYYRLGFDCISGCTAGVTETAVVGDTATGEPYYIIDGAPQDPITDLTALIVSNTITVGDTGRFLAEWEFAPFTPYNLFFYEDANDNDYTKIVETYPMGGVSSGSGANGTWEFYHTFNVPSYSDQYTPFVQWGNSYCETPTSSGCVLFDATGDGITVRDLEQASDNTLFPSTFTGSKLDDVAVGESVDFTYDIDPPCTITGRRFFLGYHPNLAYLDAGTVLSTNTGSFAASFPRTNTPYSDYFFPYINVYCDDDTSRQLYIGSTWIKGQARGISVYTAAELQRRADIATPMLNGGATDDFSNTTGFSFKSDKRVYSRLEPVLFELNYHVSFTPTSVLLYPTGTGSSAVNYGSGDTALTQNRYHRFRYSYDTSGFYHPVVQVRSSNPAVYQNIFLGGESFPIPYNQIYISEDTWSMFGSLFSTEDGIFGLDPATFSINFGSSNNEFLQSAAGGLSKVISGGLYVANFAYNILKQSPILGTVTEVIHPPDGATYVFPDKLFGFDIAAISVPLCTVQYAGASSGFKNLEWVLKAIIACYVLVFTIKSFF